MEPVSKIKTNQKNEGENAGRVTTDEQGMTLVMAKVSLETEKRHEDVQMEQNRAPAAGAYQESGPEIPRPFSVISESYQRWSKIPDFQGFERYSFGEVYEAKMLDLIHRYLELGTDERLCYIGEEKGSICEMVDKHFCLLEPVTSLIPGHIHYQETANKKAMLKVPISNVGAEDYFRTQARNAPYIPDRLFDKVLLKEAVHFFDDPKDAYKNIMETISTDGKMLIIFRPAPMNTLPYPKDAIKRITQDTEKQYMDIILDLQACGFDVQWDIETVPIIMPKVKWYAMLRDKYPPQLEIMSNFEVACGLRELSEGMLKYEGEVVEFCDRLLFVTASRSQLQTGYPTIQRFGGKAEFSFKGTQELKYQLKVTPEMAKYVAKTRTRRK